MLEVAKVVFDLMQIFKKPVLPVSEARRQRPGQTPS